MERYERQIDLIGLENQEKLQKAKVLVIGSGGLGSPTLISLAVSGIGTIGVIDCDYLMLNNLNRQVLHNEASVGERKVESAKKRLQEINSEIVVNAMDVRLNKDNAEALMREYDIIVDCVDNFESRKVVSSTATRLGKPVIEAGIEGFYGFVQIIVPGETSCFNCLEVSEREIYRQVLGASTGIIGNIQALECIKYLIGKWDKSYNYLSVDMLCMEIDKLLLTPNPKCSCVNT